MRVIVTSALALLARGAISRASMFLTFLLLLSALGAKLSFVVPGQNLVALFLSIRKIWVVDLRFPNFCSGSSGGSAATSAVSPTYSISSYTRLSIRCHSSRT
jgi:hypothetical protein